MCLKSHMHIKPVLATCVSNNNHQNIYLNICQCIQGNKVNLGHMYQGKERQNNNKNLSLSLQKHWKGGKIKKTITKIFVLNTNTIIKWLELLGASSIYSIKGVGAYKVPLGPLPYQLQYLFWCVTSEDKRFGEIFKV